MKRILIIIHNLLIFIPAVIWYGINPWRWGEAWRGMEAEHRAGIHKTVWELKKQGRVREDKEGRLWPKGNKK